MEQMELHPQEAWLIRRIRSNYRWGEIIVETRDGLPARIGKTTVYEKFGYPQKNDLTYEEILSDN